MRLTTLQELTNALLRFLKKSRKTILLIAIVATITLISNALIAIWLSKSFNIAVPSIGTISIRSVEAYGGDIKSINGVPTINWGTLQLGDSKNVSFYLRSTSNTQTRLTLNVIDWNPEGMKNYADLSWNYNGTQLAPKEEILVNFTLRTADTRDFANYIVSNNIKSYNFTMCIYAEK